MRALEICPSCGSGDVGAASGIAHCYKCKLQVSAATTREAGEKWNALAIFTRHGVAKESEQFYAAARELIERYRGWSRPAPLSEYHEDQGPVVWWTWQNGEWLGEPAWIGAPGDSDWPGYHTHWTFHPLFPEVPAIEPKEPDA